MTQREKIEQYKDIIQKLYSVEGHSKSYISRLLDVDRKTLVNTINEWGLPQAQAKRLIPSTEKFLRRKKELIYSQLMRGESLKSIAEALGIGVNRLNSVISFDEELTVLKKQYIDGIAMNAQKRLQEQKEKSSREYFKEDLPGEVWDDIAWKEGYQISNMGRVRGYVPRYKTYYIMSQYANPKNGRLYIVLNKRSYQVARLVGFSFVPGYSKEECNTIDHIDNDVTNNRADNLRWVPQSVNNKAAYDRGRSKVVCHHSHGKGTICVDGAYSFKTVAACARFLGVSPTQVRRYLSGECKSSRDISFQD